MKIIHGCCFWGFFCHFFLLFHQLRQKDVKEENEFIKICGKAKKKKKWNGGMLFSINWCFQPLPQSLNGAKSEFEIVIEQIDCENGINVKYRLLCW